MITVFGTTFPVTRWAVGWLSAIAIASAAGLAYRQIFPEELLSLKQANTRLAREVDEFGRHLMDAPVFETVALSGGLTLKVYDDGCLAIQRKTPRAVLTRLVLDMANDAPGNSSGEPPKLPDVGGVEPVAFAAGQCGGTCLNPHPGQFSWQYGRRLDACWVEVVRTWPEGCQHVQLFDACRSAWDTNTDGTPRIRWTCCRH